MRVLIAALLCGLLGGSFCARAQVADEPTPGPTVERQQESEPAPPTPTFELKEALTEKVPLIFARRLGELLGVEIRLPMGVPTDALRLDPGRWTAVAALNKIAAQMGGDWRQTFHFRKRASDRQPPVSKLPSAGHITLYGQFPWIKAVRTVGRAGGCRVYTPEEWTDRFILTYDRVPIEEALEALGEEAGYSLWRVVTLHMPAGEPASVEDDRDQFSRSVMEEAEKKAQLSANLQTTTGQELDSDEFPWESVTPYPGLVMDCSLDEIAGLLSLVRAEAEGRRAFRAPDPGVSGEPVTPPGTPDEP